MRRLVDATPASSPGFRSTYPGGPEALTILPEVFSKEPLAPAVADGDTQWAQAVEWAIFATIQAEEFGIDSTNVDTFDDDRGPEHPAASSGLEVESEDGAPCSIRVSGCRPTSPSRSSPRSATTARSSRRTSRRSDSSAASTRCGRDGGLLYAPPYR